MAQDGLRPGARIDRLGVVRTERDGAVQPPQAGRNVGRQPVDPAHRQVHEGIEWIDLDRALRGAAGGERLVGEIRRVAQEGILEMPERQPGIGTREVRVDGDGLPEQRYGCAVVGPVEAEHVLDAKVVARPGIEMVRVPEARRPCFMQQDPDFERRQHTRDDTCAYVMHAVHAEFVTLAPHHAEVARVGQFDRDPDPGRHLDRARQAIAHPQQRTDPADIRLSRGKTERRSTGDDEQPAQAGEFGKQVMRQRLGYQGIGTGSPSDWNGRMAMEGRPARSHGTIDGPSLSLAASG